MTHVPLGGPGLLPWAVERPGLAASLDNLAPGDVLLLSAPAGYGKSTAVAQWATAVDHGTTEWVSASTTRDIDIPSLVATRSSKIVVVDDLPAAWLQEVLGGLLDGLAAAPATGVRVVATSRARLPAGLATWLVRGRLDVLTEDDLAFTDAEAAALVELIVGRPVPPDVLDPVLELAAGWPAGVVAVARAWRRSPDDPGARTPIGLDAARRFVSAVLEDDHDPDVLDLFAEAAALPALSAELCDALTEPAGGGAAMLHRFRDAGAPLLVERASNLAGGTWYRLHPIAREALLHHVRRSVEGQRTDVVARAVDWFRGRGDVLAAGRILADQARWPELADLLVGNLPDLLSDGRHAGVAEVLDRVPAALMREHGSWLLGLAILELLRGEAPRALELLAIGDRWLTPPNRMLADVVRAGSASYLPDPRPAITAGEAALAACDELGDDQEYDDTYNRTTTEHYRVIVRGHLLVAGAFVGEWGRVGVHHGMPDPATLAQMPASEVVVALGQRALHLALAGEVAAAARIVAMSEGITPERDRLADQHRAAVLVASGEVARVRGRPTDAIRDFADAGARAASNNRVTLAATAAALHAHALLDRLDVEDAAAVLAGLEVPQFHRACTVAGLLASARARIAMHRSDPDVAVAALAEVTPTCHTAMAAVELAARSKNSPLLRRTLDRWPDEPTIAARVRRELGNSVWHLEVERRDLATAHLDRAIRLAARHEVVQPVRQMSHHLDPLLRALARRTGRGHPRTVAQFCSSVLETLEGPPLTRRQVTVVELLAEGLTLGEIAERLHVSLNTVKKHTRQAYRAIGVHNRGDAVAAWADRGGARDS